MHGPGKQKVAAGSNELRLNFYLLEIPCGLITLYFRQEGIYSLTLEQKGDIPNRPQVSRRAASLPWPGLAEELSAYFHGREITGDYPLIGEDYSSWTQRILRLTRAIPFGRTLTYKELAERAGVPGAARAVGQALARNRTPLLIPCHRVVGQKGKLTGFACGLAWKAKLLKLEGVILN